MKVFGREPALILAFIATAIQVASTLALNLSVEQQGYLNAAIAALFGVVTAVAVSMERAVPALIGFIQAAVAVAIAFGVEVRPEVLTAITALVAAAGAMFVRTQVSAPVPPEPGR